MATIEKRTSMKFSVPLQTEVSKYIQTKKGWPETFCVYYAEKFWNNYQASGWKLSNGNSVKDWKACFNAQWQVLKYKEDVEFFNKCMGITTNGTKINGHATNDYERLDDLLGRYLKSPVSVQLNEFRAWFDFMKAENLLKELSEDEKRDLKNVYGQDGNKLKSAWVMKTLDGYANSGLRVSDLVKMRLQLQK